jgi:lipid A 3-O-deacylase
MRWSFARRTTIEPFVDVAAGVMLTNQQVPEQTTKFNFSAHAGGGARIWISARWGVIVGYRFHHLSNANTAPRNPAINSNVVYSGLTFGRR